MHLTVYFHQLLHEMLLWVANRQQYLKAHRKHLASPTRTWNFVLMLQFLKEINRFGNPCNTLKILYGKKYRVQGHYFTVNRDNKFLSIFNIKQLTKIRSWSFNQRKTSWLSPTIYMNTLELSCCTKRTNSLADAAFQPFLTVPSFTHSLIKYNKISRQFSLWG